MPEGETLPRTRFRGTLAFRPDGAFETLVLHPSDRHYLATGTYRLEGRVIIAQYTQTHDGREVTSRWEVLEASPQGLQLRPISAAPPRAPAIDRAALVGTWTRVARGDDERFQPCDPTTPPAGAPACPMHLLADGTAVVLSVRGAARTLPGRWSIDEHSRLRITVPSEPGMNAVFELLAIEGGAVRMRSNMNPYGW